MIKVRAAGLTLLLVVAGLSGCMVRGGNLEIAPAWPIQQRAGAKAISIEISMAPLSGDKRPPKESLELHEKLVVKAYEEAGLFSKVTLGKDLAGLKAEVVVSGEEGKNNGFLFFLSGITLTLVPAKANYSPTMETVFKDSQGNTIGTIKKSEDISIWFGLFPLLVLPFRSIDVNGVLLDIHRATISDAHSRGFL